MAVPEEIVVEQKAVDESNPPLEDEDEEFYDCDAAPLPEEDCDKNYCENLGENAFFHQTLNDSLNNISQL